MVMCGLALDPDSRDRVAPAGGVRRRVGGLSVDWSGDGGLVNVVAGWLSQAIDRKETQGRKCQKGRDGGVHTHHDFRGAERQSISYTTALVGRTVSDQVDSVYLSINSRTRSGTGQLTLFLLAGPGLEVGGSREVVLHQGVEKGPGAYRGEGLVDAGGGLLVGKLDDVGGTVVELAAMARSLIFVGPCHGVLPYLRGAPGVVAHNDDGGGVPLVLIFEDTADMVEVEVREREIVDVRGVSCGETPFLAVVEAVGVRDGQVQKEEVDGWVGEIGVAGGKETTIVAGVLADVAGLVREGAGATAEEMLRIKPEVAEWADEVDRERAVWRQVGRRRLAVDPEAVIEGTSGMMRQ